MTLGVHYKGRGNHLEGKESELGLTGQVADNDIKGAWQQKKGDAVAELVVHDYYITGPLARIGYPRNRKTWRKPFSDAKYESLPRDRAMGRYPTFYADVKLRERNLETGKWGSYEKVGHFYRPITGDVIRDELFHLGLEWKTANRDEVDLRSEACIDPTVVEKKNQGLARPEKTAYVLDLSAPGKAFPQFTIQQKEKGSQQSLVWGVPVNSFYGLVGLIPFTDKEKWKMKRIEVGKLFEFSGKFGELESDLLILNQAPVRGFFTSRPVDYDIEGSDYKVHAQISTQSIKKHLSGGLFGPGLIRDQKVKIFSRELMQQESYKALALLSEVVRNDLKEGQPKKLHRTRRFSNVLPDEIFLFKS